MIPKQITIEGYGAYVEQIQVSFDGLASVALVGDNGSGKSTLLSAIPFALFGESRTGDLDKEVNESSRKAKVSLEFSAQGQTFRVTRERTAPRKVGSQGKSSAFLERFSEEAQQWELMVNGVRSVNSEVEGLLGATPEVLMSSVFASQGDAGRFTAESGPAQRRDLLFAILSLTSYAKGSDRANKMRRESEQEAGRLEGKFAALNDQGEQLESAELEVDRASELLEQAEQALEEAEKKAASYADLVTEAQSRLSEAEASFDVAEQANESELAHLKSVQAAADSSVDAFSRESALVKQLSEQRSQVESELRGLVKKRGELEQAVGALSEAVESHEESANESSGRVAKQEEESRRLRDEVVKTQTSLESSRTMAERLTALLGDGDSELDESDITKAQSELEELKRNLAHLEGARDFAMEGIEAFKGGQRDSCRICAQALDDDAQDATLVHDISASRSFQRDVTSAEKDAQVAEENLRAIAGPHDQPIGNAQERLAATREEVAHLESHLRSAAKASKAAGEQLVEIRRVQAEEERSRQQRRADLVEATQALASTEQSISQLEESLSKATAARDEHEMESELAELVLQQEEAVRQLQEFDAVTQLGSLRTQLDEARGRHAEALRELEGFQKGQLAQTSAKRDLAIAELAEKESKVKVIEAALVEAQKVKQQVEESRRSSYLNGLVEMATGSAGIPSLILDEVISDLSAVATEILRDLSSQRFSVVFETTETNKSGREKSSLGIAVHDGHSTRSYDTFSGGERMRIDIAVRIGLSIMLARRSGAPLEFLTIDEGFGALDDEGIHVLTNALAQLQERFALIMVVTHVPDVAAAFPSRIEFSRTAPGKSPNVAII